MASSYALERDGRGISRPKDKRILLVLDVNGFLVDTRFVAEGKLKEREEDAIVNKFWVYNRPYVREFVQFCLDNFFVGVWSSSKRHNLLGLVQHIFRDAVGQLAFIWDQSHCTDTRLRHPENRQKPVFLKDLSRIWMTPELWHSGFGQFNTLLIDDSPYKSLVNPPYTSIFPATYVGTDLADGCLGDGGSIRSYLESISQVRVVPEFVKRNPYAAPRDTMGAEAWALFVNFRQKYNFGSLWIGAGGGSGSHAANQQLSQVERGRYGGVNTVKSAVIVPNDETMPVDSLELRRDGTNGPCTTGNNEEKEEGELVPEEEEEEDHKDRELSKDTKSEEKEEENEKAGGSPARESMLLNGQEREGAETDGESDRHGVVQQDIGSLSSVRKSTGEEVVVARRAISDDEESELDEGEEVRRGSGDISECEHNEGDQCETSEQDRSDLLSRERVSSASVRGDEHMAEQLIVSEQTRQANTAASGYVDGSERDPNGSDLPETEEKVVEAAMLLPRQEGERHEEGANETSIPVEEPRVKVRMKSIIVGVCEPEPIPERNDNGRVGNTGLWKKRKNNGKRKSKKRAMAVKGDGAFGLTNKNSKTKSMFVLDAQMDSSLRNNTTSSVILLGKKKARGQSQWQPLNKLPIEQRLGNLNGRLSFVGGMDGSNQNIIFGGDGLLGSQPKKDKPPRKKKKAKVGQKKGKCMQLQLQQQQLPQQMATTQELAATPVASSIRPIAQDWVQGGYGSRGASRRPGDRLHPEEDFDSLGRREERYDGNIGHNRRWNGSISPVKRPSDSPRKWRDRSLPRHDGSGMGTVRRVGVACRRSISPLRRDADKHEDFRHGRERGRREGRSGSKSRSRSRERYPVRGVDRGCEVMLNSRAGNRRVDERVAGGGGKGSPRKDVPSGSGVNSGRFWTSRDGGVRSGRGNFRSVGMCHRQYLHGSARPGSHSFDDTSHTQEAGPPYFYRDRESSDNLTCDRVHASEWNQVQAPAARRGRDNHVYESSASGMMTRKSWR